MRNNAGHPSSSSSAAAPGSSSVSMPTRNATSPARAGHPSSSSTSPVRAGQPSSSSPKGSANVDKHDADFMVLEYSCRDSSVLSTLGKHCKESNWMIAVGVETDPIHITLHVDKQVALSPEVFVQCDGKKVFPIDPGRHKSKLRQDFRWNRSFRGTLRGLAEKNFFEVRPEHLSHERWYAATLTEQREDGLFKAIVQMPDGRGGFSPMDLPAVTIENVREAAGKRPVSIPMRTLTLQVPMRDPLHAQLAIDNDPITHFFARPTPPPVQQGKGKGKNRVTFTVSRDRMQVRADVGHSILDHFLSGQVRGMRQEADELKHAWHFQVGPFANHIVEVEKRYRSSNLVSLFVDGTLLVESTAQDMGRADGNWQCSFRLLGERFMDWQVFESDGNGMNLNTQGVVTHRSKYVHEVIVHFKESDKSLIPARLYVDGVDFVDLAHGRPELQEERIVCAPQALSASYGLLVPYRVNESAPFPHLGFSSKGLGGGYDTGPTSIAGLLSAFNVCCSKQHGPDSEIYA